MRMFDIIAKKRHNNILTDEEIAFFVNGYTSGNIPDYQASALCMAICCNGMSDSETFELTKCMMNSGDTVDLSSLPHTVDKHSTGGVGDLTSLIVAPTCASLGLSCAKMSGRGLGHTGGTIDKLESIPGFRTSLTSEEFFSQIKRIGVSIIGQSSDLAPADKKLYALRDVTATVDSIPLIASSIMSKKLAAGSETIILDVKYGSGAFMKTIDGARELASLMVRIGNSMGRKTAALVTSMQYPLGKKIGNTLEVTEAAELLRGEYTGNAMTVSLAIISTVYSLSCGIPYEEAEKRAKEEINSGRSYSKFLEWIKAQGGDSEAVDKNRLAIAPYKKEIKAPIDGYILGADTEKIGFTSCVLGAGRITKDDVPDLSAGLVLHVDQCDKVSKGDTVATLYSSSEEKLNAGEEVFKEAISYCTGKEEAEKNFAPLIADIIR